MYERSHVSVKVEPSSTSRLVSTLYILPLFYLKFTYVNVRSQKRVIGNHWSLKQAKDFSANLQR